MLQTMRSAPHGLANGGQHQTASAAPAARSSSSSSRRGKFNVPELMQQPYYDDLGQERVRTWKTGEFLGRGGFAEVYIITDLDTNEKFAGKVVAKSSLQKKKAKDKLRMEIAIHQSLNHKHVVKFVSYFEVAEFYVIVLELCTNRSMMELLRQRKMLTEPEARYFLAQMLSAMSHMHGRRIIHRDLKLGNIFLNANMEVKIGDFGLATQLEYDDERKRTICGTPNYIAPEVLGGGQHGHSYQVDIWSLGVVLYTWIIGRPPFETNDVKETYKRIRRSNFYFPENRRISDEAKDLIVRMLQKNPDARPTLDEVAEHPFFSSHYLPTSLPSTAMVMVPKLPDMAKRMASAPAIVRHAHSENAAPNQANPLLFGGVPSTAALHVPPPAGSMRSPRVRGTRASPLGARDVNMGEVGPAAQKARAGGRENIVDLIHRTLVDALEMQSQNGAIVGNFVSHRSAPQPPSVWIHRWGDYSAKYGLAYQYNTGSFGAYFNDSTIMVMDPAQTAVDYVERQAGREARQTFPVGAYPSELKKKVNLLQYFTNYLPSKSAAVGQVDSAHEAARRVAGRPLVYVRKWLKTRHAVFFRLTDNTLQVNFTDGTGVILSAKGSVVTFIDKKNQMLTLWLTEVAQHEQGQSISSRLSYIRDMLACLINKRSE